MNIYIAQSLLFCLSKAVVLGIIIMEGSKWDRGFILRSSSDDYLSSA